MSQKKLTRFADYGIKNKLLTFKTAMLIYRSETNLDVKTLFNEITDHLDPTIRNRSYTAYTINNPFSNA